MAVADEAELTAYGSVSTVRLRQFYRLTEALAAATTLREVAETVLELAPQVTDARAAILGLHVDVLLPAVQGIDDGLGDAPWVDLGDDSFDILERGATEEGSSLSLRGYHPEAEGPHRAVLLPLRRYDSTPLGVLALVGDPNGLNAGAAHLNAVANQIGQALARAGLFEHEHRLAQRLQMNLLPSLANPPSLHVAARYSPGSDLLAVGGDWYDLFELPNGRIGMAIGDVAGHGLAEAAIMAQLRNALRAFALSGDGDPAGVLAYLERFLAVYLPDQMATVCYLEFDPGRGAVRWANAGHMPPLLVSPRGVTRFLTEHSTLLGLGLNRSVPDTYHTVIEPGSSLLLYTDGLVERRGEELDRSLEFLAALASEVYLLEPDMLCRMLVDHRAKETHPDDRALMVVRFRH